jgi:hypothetical protein
MTTKELKKYVGKEVTVEHNHDGHTTMEGWELEHVNGDTFRIGDLQFTPQNIVKSRMSKNYGAITIE